MAMFELFGVGKAWAGAFKADPLQERRKTGFGDSPITADALTINDSAAGASETEQARDRLRKATGVLHMAIGGFVRGAAPTFATPLSGRTSSPAIVGGMSARVDAIDVDYYGVQTTIEVNSRTSTVRTSSAAIGLDATTPEAASLLTSSGSLTLDTIGAASVKTSTAEMNTGRLTSYGSSSVTFAGGGGTSTSVGSLSGTYNGSGKAADATSLELTVTKGGTIQPSLLGLGQTKIAFDVRDQTGEVVFSFNGNVKAGETISLGSDIGLSIEFGAGELQAGHKASTTVSSTPITVDADARFDAAAGVRPQFQAVAAVTAGSFEVNDTVIQVFGDDTINAVLDRINGSAAGVTATLSGDKITLTSNGNSDQNIDIGSDTSGFLQAVKLAGASTVKGNLRDDERLLKDTSAFSTVRTGTFTINGQTIAVDKDQDTLATVLARINASAAGVSASLDLTTKRIEIVSTTNSEAVIDVGNDTTGFLAKARLSSGNTVLGNIRDDRQVLSDVSRFAAVTSGSFSVNGVSTSVDKDSDSLASIIDRINGSGAGVTAGYDAATDRLTFTPDVAGATLSVEGDTTGLLSALKVASGTAATRANADGAFNAIGVNGPLLDAGQSVRAGSFTVNGVTIAVAADDTINSVLARITASAAGVVATYDAAADRVSVTSVESGAAVAIGSDTSGFLAAVKLDGTATTSISTVSYSSFDTALGEMSEYSGVRTGTVTVNGHDIAIDPMTTTVTSLVDALNALTGVSASIDRTSGAVQVRSDPGRSLTISDTSGVLDALGIDGGMYAGRKGTPAAVGTQATEGVNSNAGEVAARVTAAIADMNEALEKAGHPGLRSTLEGVIDRLRDQGIHGFNVAEDDEPVTISVSTADLIDSLEAIDADVDLGRILSPILDALETAVAAVAEWDARPTAAHTLSLDTTSRAQLTADQTAGSLLFVRSSLQPKESEAARRTVIKAYGAQP